MKRKNRTSKPVLRSDGLLFASIIEAAKNTKGSNTKNISACVHGKRASCAGYTWEFLENDPTIKRLKNEKQRLLNKERTIFPRRKVKCLTNNKIYGTITEAAKELKLTTGIISRVCNGVRNHARGYKFEYYKEVA